VIPEGSKAFILCVPDDPFFYGVVMGALKVMTFNYYWQGTREDVEAVTDRMKTMYYDYQEQVGCMICDMVAECFETENPRLMEAVAAAMRNNPELRQAISSAITQEGGGVPSAPITEQEAQSDTLPDNVRDSEGNCILDNLWGGMLYLVQSGNRVITDFFEVIEVATNTLETMEIVSQTMPAAGAYISAAAGFADQLAENLQEGYSGAYTEAYEQSLACDLFCAAQDGCELTPEQIMNVINARLTAPIDIGDFGELMAGVASGTWIGDEIADVMFLIYFSALRFGQQFGDQIGIRPLSVIISLGADQLSSDNWEILCDCDVVIPNILLRETYPGLIPNDPIFIANTETGGSIWSCTKVFFGSSYAVAVVPYNAGVDICATLISATDVSDYQHQQCGGGLVAGLGDGASPPDWSSFGWFSASPGTVLIELQPA